MKKIPINEDKLEIYRKLEENDLYDGLRVGMIRKLLVGLGIRVSGSTVAHSDDLRELLKNTVKRVLYREELLMLGIDGRRVNKEIDERVRMDKS